MGYVGMYRLKRTSNIINVHYMVHSINESSPTIGEARIYVLYQIQFSFNPVWSLNRRRRRPKVLAALRDLNDSTCFPLHQILGPRHHRPLALESGMAM